jgi:hypothetical protein
MSRKAEWQKVCAALRETPRGRLRARHEHALYQLAVEDGRRALLSMNHRLTREQLDDLVHDFLATRLQHVIDADNNPRALFIVSLVRAAQRTLGRLAREVPHERTTYGDVDLDRAPLDPESSVMLRLDGAALLSAVSARDRDVLLAVALGEDREEIAKAHAIGRAAVDQIVSRFRKLASAGGER